MRLILGMGKAVSVGKSHPHRFVGLNIDMTGLAALEGDEDGDAGQVPATALA